MSLKSTFAVEVGKLISFGKKRGVSLDDMIEELEFAKDGLEAGPAPPDPPAARRGPRRAPRGRHHAEGGVMGEPTWQEIEAEAQRRGKLDFDNTGRSWTLAEKIVEVMNEGWTPPEPVDPDLLAFREWYAGEWPLQTGESILAGAWDHGIAATGYLAGSRMARERAKVLEEYVKIDEHGPHLWTRERARKALAKYRGEA